jgi:hypothetical protein
MSELAEIETAVMKLTDATASMLRHLNLAAPSDVQTRLRLDRKLAWQIHRLGGSASGREAVRFLPTAKRFARFLTAAAESGVTAQDVEQAGRLREEVSKVVSRHAADQSLLECMSGAQGQQARSRLAQRRALFSSSTQVIGTAADTQVSLSVLRVDAETGMIDQATLDSLQGLRRFRPGVPLGLVAKRSSGGKPTEPIDPEAARRYGADVVRKFTNLTPGRLRTYETPDGFRRVEVLSESVGMARGIDYTLGRVRRDIGSIAEASAKFEYHLRCRPRHPLRRLLLGCLVPASIAVPIRPRVNSYWHYLSAEGSLDFDERESLPSLDELIVFDEPTARPEVHAPGGCDPAMIRYLLQKLGWRDTAYRCYWAAADFPATGATTVLSLDSLPEETRADST